MRDDKDTEVMRVLRPIIKPFFVGFGFLTLLAALATLSMGTILAWFFSISCGVLGFVGLMAIIVYIMEASS